MLGVKYGVLWGTEQGPRTWPRGLRAASLEEGHQEKSGLGLAKMRGLREHPRHKGSHVTT